MAQPGAFTQAQVKVGDVLEASAPRGNFTLRQGDGPVVGAVGYRPEPVEPPADGSVFLCCLRPTGDIVIDL